jgi:hypothetical protein
MRALTWSMSALSSSSLSLSAAMPVNRPSIARSMRSKRSLT